MDEAIKWLVAQSPLSGSALITISGIGLLTTAFERTAPDESKRRVAAWIRDLRPVEATAEVPTCFPSTFLFFFRGSLFSRAFLNRAATVSVFLTVALFLAFKAWPPGREALQAEGSRNFDFLPLVTAVAIIVPNALSLAKSRALVGVMLNRPLVVQGVLVILDAALSAAVASGAFLLYTAVAPAHQHLDVPQRVAQLPDVIAGRHLFTPFWYSSFLATYWAGLFFVSVVTLHSIAGPMQKSLSFLRFVIDIDAKPFQAIGVMAMALVIVGFGTFSLVLAFR